MKKLNALLAIVPVCTAVVCAVFFWYEYGLISLAFDAAIILFCHLQVCFTNWDTFFSGLWSG